MNAECTLPVGKTHTTYISPSNEYYICGVHQTTGKSVSLLVSSQARTYTTIKGIGCATGEKLYKKLRGNTINLFYRTRSRISQDLQ